MEGKELFKSVLVGGYDKDDVIEYVNSLECEYERTKINFMMEKKELLDRLETVKQELKKEQEDRLIQKQKIQELQEEKEDAGRRAEAVCLQKEEMQRQLEDVEEQLEEMRRCQQELEAQNSEKLEWMLDEIKQQENKLLEAKDKIKESIRRQKEEQQREIAALQEKLREREKECENYSKEIQSRDIKIQEMKKAREQIAQLRNEAAPRQKKETRSQAQIGREAQEKDKLLENMHHLQKSCEKEMYNLQKRYQGESQRLKRQIESLKKCNAGLAERCCRAEARIADRQRGEAGKPGGDGMMKRLSPVIETVKRSVGGMTVHREIPAVSPQVPSKATDEGSMERSPEAEENSNAEPVRKEDFFEEGESAEQQYRRHAEDVNRSIARAQERIARMLEDLQRDVGTEEPSAPNLRQ